ncbi:hypothetical protein V1515DRAFT_624349 [Lipomyces mesembrius]
MRLENLDTPHALPPPIAHMVLECQLGQTICKIPGVASGVLLPAHAGSIQQEVEQWFATLPPAYKAVDPDTHWDKVYHYVALQLLEPLHHTPEHGLKYQSLWAAGVGAGANRRGQEGEGLGGREDEDEADQEDEKKKGWRGTGRKEQWQQE